MIKLNVNILLPFSMKTKSFGRFLSVQSRIDFQIKLCQYAYMHIHFKTKFKIANIHKVNVLLVIIYQHSHS